MGISLLKSFLDSCTLSVCTRVECMLCAVKKLNKEEKNSKATEYI